MTKVRVDASRAYDIVIERGLLDRAGEYIRAATGAKKAVVVTDANVAALYLERVCASLRAVGLETETFTAQAGEGAKSLAVYGELLEFLSRGGLTRTDTLVALGGGVIGDLTGFAAATYQRGTGFVQLPTTLLADVDSSVGGKTAVNLPTGKNQVGCFYQPHLVLCDPDALGTLPDEQYRCGCAEVIKYGVLGNEAFFEELKTPVSEQVEHVIETCVKMKRELVMRDEFDRGARQLLNLGHSFGHAVEACSDFTILHGQAVAVGMAMIARAAAKRGFCTQETASRIVSLLQRYKLPTETDFTAAELFAAVGADKKRTGATMHLVVPEEIGKCRIVPVPFSDVRGWLQDGGAR
ncbi:MAG: 3-dehydroquinate synthase [Oscillospiraceae bacterium]|nr:3-dehydroquinate synthase [Oscillospiraceae bacterium]